LIHTMCLEEPAAKWPKDLALTYRTERLTFSDLNEQVPTRGSCAFLPDRFHSLFVRSTRSLQDQGCWEALSGTGLGSASAGFGQAKKGCI
jgi:hypothetical protein